MSEEKHKPWCSERAREENGGCICESPSSSDAPAGSPVVAWKKGILRVNDNDDPYCAEVHVLTIDGRTVLRAIAPSHGLGDPVSDADRKLIGQALSEHLAKLKDEQAKNRNLMKLIWAIVQKHGGEIRLNGSERCILHDDWELLEYTDIETQELVIKSRCANNTQSQSR